MSAPAIKNGGQAFPVSDLQAVHAIAAATIEGITDTVERDRIYTAVRGQAAQGMTLRDYFAAKAMQGICAHSDTWGLDDAEIAARSYTVADLMLRAREQVKATGEAS